MRTRRGIMEALIQVALTSLQATHHDDYEVVDVGKVAKSRMIQALPPRLLELLQDAEAKLSVRGGSAGARGWRRTPSNSIDSASSSPGSPRFDRSGALVLSSPSAMSSSPLSPTAGRKTPRAGARWTPRNRSPSFGRQRSPSRSGATIFDFPIEVIAGQLTIVDSALFRKIPTLEFLNKSWDRNRYEHVAEHTNHWVDRFNAMIEFMATLVLQGDGAADRAHRLEYLIDLGDALWQPPFYNFMGASMVNMALEHLALKKIQSWKLVPRKEVPPGGRIIPNGQTKQVPKRQTLKSRLKWLFWHQNNYINYRQYGIGSVPPNTPAIPAMIVHHKDLFDTHEGAPHLLCRECGRRAMKDMDKCIKCKQPLDKSYRNFDRARNLGRFVQRLSRLQRLVYRGIVLDREICNLIGRGVQSHLMFFEPHKRAATKQMLAEGGAVGLSELAELAGRAEAQAAQQGGGDNGGPNP